MQMSGEGEKERVQAWTLDMSQVGRVRLQSRGKVLNHGRLGFLQDARSLRLGQWASRVRVELVGYEKF